LVRTDHYDSLARQLRAGEIDLMTGLSMTPPHDARHCIAREVVWVRSKAFRFDPNRPIPLVSYGSTCMYHRLTVRALKESGLDWEDVFIGPSVQSLWAAVNAGLGVMALTRRRALEEGDMIWDDAPLPKLPDLYSGVMIREGGPRAIYEHLADDIAGTVHRRVQADTRSKWIDIDKAARKANSAA
jgi:DNA-binding transcriptional LysR family regulator